MIFYYKIILIILYANYYEVGGRQDHITGQILTVMSIMSQNIYVNFAYYHIVLVLNEITITNNYKVLLLLSQCTLILDRCPRCQRKDILKLHLQVKCNSCGYCYLKKNCPKCTSLIANLDYNKRDIGQWVGCFTCRSCGTTYTDVINV